MIARERAVRHEASKASNCLKQEERPKRSKIREIRPADRTRTSGRLKRSPREKTAAADQNDRNAPKKEPGTNGGEARKEGEAESGVGLHVQRGLQRRRLNMDCLRIRRNTRAGESAYMKRLNWLAQEAAGEIFIFLVGG